MVRRTRVRAGAAVIVASMLVVGATGADEETVRAPGTPVAWHGDGAAVELRDAPQQWSIGDPSADEQLLLELMNRARLDPVGEGDRVFDDYGSNRVRQAVDYFLDQRPGVEFTRSENRAAFKGYDAKPPFAFNGDLIDAARGHSAKMLEYDQQSHRIEDKKGDPLLDDQGQPVEKDLRGRIEDEGYVGGSLAESVFSYAHDMVHAHAGFAIDYGQGVPQGENRPYLGHRLNLMGYDGDPVRDYREVGIGVVDDPSEANEVGPKLVTIDFAKSFAGPRVFVTGVCYDDANGNDFYDLGEGLADVRITVDTSSVFAVSSASGGWAIPVDDGIVRVTATAAPGTPAESVVGTQTVTVDVDGANVKVDFGRPPDPPLPAALEFASAPDLPIPDAGTTDATIVVGDQAAGAEQVGDVGVEVDVDHPDRSQLTLTLVSPSGTEVRLFDRAPGGSGLAGVFDASLHPRGSFADFLGQSSKGTWTLRVADQGGGDTGTLRSWKLRIQPQWVRTLYAPASPLFVTKLKLKDSPLAAGDGIVFKAVVDTQGVAPDTSAPRELRILSDDASHTVLAFVALAPEAVTYRVDGTSRTLVAAKAGGLDLPSPLPASVEVELAIGGAIVRRVVPLAKGGFNGATTRPPGHLFRVDSLLTKSKAGVTTYTVKGRLGRDADTFGTGAFEVSLGAFRYKDSMQAMVVSSAKATFKAPSGVKKLVVVRSTGAFTLVVATGEDVRPGETADLSIRLGDDGFYGATRFVPRESGPFLTY